MKSLSLVVIMLVSSLAMAATTQDLKKKIEAKVRDSGVPSSEFTLYVTVGDESPEVLLDVNAHKALIPASVTKVLTSSAILEIFPPGSKFKTSLWIDQTPKDGTLKGAIYLKGGGDPSFVSENLWFLVNHFKRTGIQKIEGGIVVDDSVFDSVRFDESREDARVDRAYDAPVGGMSFNWNSVNIFVRPGKSGEQARVFLDPENSYTRLVNKTKTVKGSANNIVVDREKNANQGDTVIVSGNIGTEKDEVVVYKNITRPDLWAGENLRSFLSQRGIEVVGAVTNGKVPGKAWSVAESESKAVEEILADMNKFSNNFVAEMLTKNMSSRQSTPATLNKGVEMINAHLKNLGLPESEYKILNPSGLTRDNRLSAFSLWKVLNHLRTDFHVQPEFLTSLPISGVDGTLKKRMGGDAAARGVRAKTGLLTGVTALSGYAGRDDGRVLTFVFIHNGSRDESRIRRLFDEWLTALIQ